MARKRRNQRPDPKVQLPQQARREIAMIFLFTLAGLSLLAYFNLAGRAGLFIDNALAGLLGALRPLLPFVLIAMGALLAKSPPRSLAFLGLILFSVALTSLTHLIQYPGQTGFIAIEQGLGGGYLGLFIAYPLYQLFGFWATAIILVAFIFIALSLLASSTFTQLLHYIKQLASFALAKIANLYSFFSKPRINGEYEEKSAEQELHFEEHQIEATRKIDSADSAQQDAEANNSVLDQPDSLATDLKIVPRKRIGRIELPLDLLEKNNGKPVSGNIRGRQEIIEKTLRNFGIAVEMGEVSVGPTVTQYTLRPAEGVKLSSITALSNDLALALAAHPIRIEAPIPGKALVGIEVPNEQISTVRLREILESQEWQKRTSPLTVILGKDVSGKPYLADLSRMPHLLVAGSTGSGKTVCLNTIIVSLLYQNSPDDLKLLLVDPKRVELPSYNEIPHLISPVITDVKQTVQALRFALIEMERRFGLLSAAGARDIKSYNEAKSAEERMPYLIIIVDELADLMVAATSEVEASIIRLAQMARAVGIHLILATQRPSVDVITGLIKANITSRIAFSVASLIDSRTILDASGAEKLLGRGDMLFITSELGKPKRLQGAYVSDQEIRKVVSHLRRAGTPEYVEIAAQGSASIFNDPNATANDSDPLLAEAKETILQAGKASASLLQRRLKLGYARAARILDLLEAEGFIGPGEGAKPREILTPHE